MFKIQFHTSNAAFEDGAASESARILRHVAAEIEDGHLEGVVIDSNGNLIGAFKLDGSDA
jgi:hypothetical protein